MELTDAQNIFAVNLQIITIAFLIHNFFAHTQLECIPKNQCPPLQNSTTTEKGFKTLVDSTGCCPTSKLVCDRSLCPVKPAKCVKEFYEVQIVKTANKTGCCDEYECSKNINFFYYKEMK